jgi:hypothetical protein
MISRNALTQKLSQLKKFQFLGYTGEDGLGNHVARLRVLEFADKGFAYENQIFDFVIIDSARGLRAVNQTRGIIFTKLE